MRLVLSDGREVDRDLERLLVGPVFEPLRASEECFRAVTAEGGTLVWPGEIDLDPDVVIWGGPEPKDRTEPPRTMRLQLPLALALAASRSRSDPGNARSPGH